MDSNAGRDRIIENIKKDKNYYDPDTDTCGKNVLAIVNQEVTMPVQLGKEVKLSCRSVAMSEPRWIHYQYTINVHEEEEDITELSVSGGIEGLTVSKAVLSVKQKSKKAKKLAV